MSIVPSIVRVTFISPIKLEPGTEHNINSGVSLFKLVKAELKRSPERLVCKGSSQQGHFKQGCSSSPTGDGFALDPLFHLWRDHIQHLWNFRPLLFMTVE